MNGWRGGGYFIVRGEERGGGGGGWYERYEHMRLDFSLC